MKLLRENKKLYSDAPEHNTPVINQKHSVGTYADVVNELKSLTLEFVQKVGI